VLVPNDNGNEQVGTENTPCRESTKEMN